MKAHCPTVGWPARDTPSSVLSPFGAPGCVRDGNPEEANSGVNGGMGEQLPLLGEDPNTDGWI